MSLECNMSTIAVDDDGTELAYLDSGAPASSTYLTVFTVHGIVFGFHIYEKLIRLAPTSGVRVVAIGRRGYPGSTPFLPSEIDSLPTSNDEQKEAFLSARACEVATFIHKFTEQNALPPLSTDGTTGGIVVLGWSLGCTLPVALLSHIDTYPASVRACLTSRLRAVVFHDLPSIAIASPRFSRSWSPLMDPTLTPDQALRISAQWLTSYFRHGDLSTRSTDVLEVAVPATFRPPSIFTMSDSQIDRIVSYDSNKPDLVWCASSATQLRASYAKAFFGESVRAALPHVKIRLIVGECSFASSMPTAWHVEDDNAARGGGFLSVKWVKDANHFTHWDDPELALQTILEVIAE